MADRGRNCVVFIVEGDSDRIALEQPMTALFDMIDETIKVVFCKPGSNGVQGATSSIKKQVV